MTLSARQAKLIRGLGRRRNRQASGLFLAEGVRVVEDLVHSGLRVRAVVVASSAEDDPRVAAVLARAAQHGAEIARALPHEVDALAGTDTPQGVLAVAKIPAASLDTLRLPPGGAHLLVLDAVQDPGNFGTLVRTAEALGAAAVVALPGTVDAWNAKSVRAAAGSSFRVPIVAAAWDELGPWLRERAVPVVVADAGGTPLPPGPWAASALVVGNEGGGPSAASLAAADHVAAIPLRGRAESLNVAAAAAILLHQLVS